MCTHRRDLQVKTNVEVAAFANDTALFTKDYDSVAAPKNLQAFLNDLEKLARQWSINSSKTVHITLTTRHDTCQLVDVNDLISRENESLYLGILVNSRMTWKDHIKIKGKEIININSEKYIDY